MISIVINYYFFVRIYKEVFVHIVYRKEAHKFDFREMGDENVSNHVDYIFSPPNMTLDRINR